jgi:hypothetical protein
MAGSMCGTFEVTVGARALFALSASHQEPLVLPSRSDVEARLAATSAMWQQWSSGLQLGIGWPTIVMRSALALKLLVHAPSGAIAAAATASLPEVLGGERNWDYRFCWVRDSAFALNALLRLGCFDEADAFFWWLMQASQLTHPRLGVLYRINGGADARERMLGLPGYRGSTPVRIGNDAAGQLQLDVYGDLLQAAWFYAQAGRTLDADIGGRLAEIADLVCEIWSEPDAGLWEVRSGPLHFTQSKMMCAVALDRALMGPESRTKQAGTDIGRLRTPRRHHAEGYQRAGWGISGSERASEATPYSTASTDEWGRRPSHKLRRASTWGGRPKFRSEGNWNTVQARRAPSDRKLVSSKSRTVRRVRPFAENRLQNRFGEAIVT